MESLPRFAVGTLQPRADALPLLWALMDVLDRENIHVQNFLPRACFAPHFGAASAVGLSPRYLDSWLMSEEVCREVFRHGAASCDVAVVEGCYDGALSDTSAAGGRLDVLCRWLDLPRLAVLDVSSTDQCLLPSKPWGIEGILLDGFRDEAQLARLQTRLESLWGVPVLGGLDQAPALRKHIARLPSSWTPLRSLCEALGDRLARNLDLRRVLSIASRREFSPVASRRLRPSTHLETVTVAVAFDDAFNGYFPGTLDLLELQGATVRVFSPLRDERLPIDTDVVYLGCGHPELYLKELTANHCMMQALRSHLFSSGRLYAEGGGLAYLAEEIEMPDGSSASMVGALPIRCRLNRSPSPPAPVEITLACGNWLGEGWSRIRGYLNDRWHVEPTGPLTSYAAQAGRQWDLIGTQQVIGSRIHINFAGQPDFLRSFFTPHSAGVDFAL